MTEIQEGASSRSGEALTASVSQSAQIAAPFSGSVGESATTPPPGAPRSLHASSDGAYSWPEDALERVLKAVEETSAAVRALVEPLAPVEPTGLGAVVECIYDNHYVRVGGSEEPWQHTRGVGRCSWFDLAVVKVLSEGVAL